MKRRIFPILCSVFILLVLGTLGFFTINFKLALDTANATNQQQNLHITSLENALKEKEDYILGQEDYVNELSQQLSAMEKLPEDESDTDNSNHSSASYQKKYPDMYAQAKYEERNGITDNQKTVYLTFDDGPSKLTPQVLDILDEYHAKATFFVVYNESPSYTEYLSEIVNRGHTLALHSYSHNYQKIYASVDAFLKDFEKVYNWVYEETGVRPTLFRFPGGSTNGSASIVREIIDEMQRRGFIHYDWNVSSGDGSTLTTSENIIDNVTTTVGNPKMPVVLMHDGPGNNATLKALPTVLENLKNMGYTFESLDETLTPVQFRKGN